MIQPILALTLGIITIYLDLAFFFFFFFFFQTWLIFFLIKFWGLNNWITDVPLLEEVEEQEGTC